MLDWNDLWAACALYLIIEGLMPFLNPGALKQALLHLARLEDRTVRFVGFASMVAGAVLLYVVRGTL